MGGIAAKSIVDRVAPLRNVKEACRKELAARFGDVVTFDVPLARLTTYRIGGPASVLVEPRSGQEVAAVMGAADELAVPRLTLGLGSNVLAPDQGFDGVVIRLGEGVAGVEQEGPDGAVWTVGAGLPIPLLARRTAAAGFGGVHRLIGVPGTVGGGVFMNAGAHGQEFKDVVRWVDIVEDTGVIARVQGGGIPWQYRRSGLAGIVLAAQLELTAADPAHLKSEIERYLEWRKTGTPFEQPCCGSVFRNPEPDVRASGVSDLPRPPTAGRMIDAAGMKGFRVAGAEVSFKHANYIVNTGGATAADVMKVIDGVRQRVLEAFGVELVLEVKILEPV